jgi:alkylhydroperoxidase family enzyme
MSMTTTPRSHNTDEQRRARIRVPVRMPKGLLGRVMVWWSKRAFGDVPDPGLVLWHNRKVMCATIGYERKIEKFDSLEADLKNLAVLAAAAKIGCSWCMDFGYFAAYHSGQSVEKFAQVPCWRESDVFTPTERNVLAFAEAMTATPPEVTDEIVDRLVGQLGVPAVVELAKMVAVENERSRFNSSMGLASQGFSDRCEVPRR